MTGEEPVANIVPEGMDCITQSREVAREAVVGVMQLVPTAGGHPAAHQGNEEELPRAPQLLKGTVARDFLPLVVSTNRPHIVPEFTPKNIF